MGRDVGLCTIWGIFIPGHVQLFFQDVFDTLIGHRIAVYGSTACIVKSFGAILPVELYNTHGPFVGSFRVVTFNEESLYTGQHVFPVFSCHIFKKLRTPVHIVLRVLHKWSEMVLNFPFVSSRGCKAIRSWKKYTSTVVLV